MHEGSPARRVLQQSNLERTRAWARSCSECSVWKDLILLMLCNANMHDQAVFTICDAGLDHKICLRSQGYICSNSQKYIARVKIIYFSFMPKIIRILSKDHVP